MKEKRYFEAHYMLTLTHPVAVCTIAHNRSSNGQRSSNLGLFGDWMHQTSVGRFYTVAIRNEFSTMINSSDAIIFGTLANGRNVAKPALRPIDSVTELRDTLLRAAPSITLLLSMSSSSSPASTPVRSTLVSDSVT
uniref:Uncharacterized protein n=1 Tax=Anopheles culicifacies TaxID=139723 RepID=A0A182MAQ3_9DIPT